MRRKVLGFLIAGLVGSHDAMGAAAEDPGTSMFSLGGFGTFGVVHSTEHSADFISSPFEAVGAGHTRSWSAAVDSLVGVQVTANLNSRLSAVVQVVSQQNAEDNFKPHVQWANVKYRLSPDFDVRIGRIAQPLFLVADSLNVGYANPWLRPPVELYSAVLFTSSDGVDASYRFRMGTASNTVQVAIGHSNHDFPLPDGLGATTAKSRRQIALVDSVERGFGTLRLTYSQADATVSYLDPLFDGFRQFGVQGDGIADRYDVHARLVRFYGISASYEPGEWFAMSEWGHIDTHSSLGEKTGWYVSGGRRMGTVTPYLTYAHLRADSNPSDPGLSLTGLTPSAAAFAAALNAGLNQVLGSVAAQRTISAGARWDFMDSVDLKLQYDYTRLAAHSRGTLTNFQPDFQRGTSFGLISLAIDFVF